MVRDLGIPKEKEKEIALRIVEEIKKRNIPKKKLDALKKKISREYGLKDIFPNTKIMEYVSEEDKELVRNVIMRKPVRSISGVSIVAVMIPVKTCPGKCIYCPSRDAPKSYTGKEPAAMRAKMFNYDPYVQVKERIKQLELIGHPTDKIELIIMGGTFPYEPEDFQRHFVKRMFDALNGVEAKNLEEAIKLNEKAKHRSVGLTIETRPDYCGEKEINLMLEMGCTRVELGVQSLNNEVLDKVQRGHSVEQTIEAIRLLKDSGLKVVAHMMPGLFQNKEEDLRMFHKLFYDSNFKPDMLKMYPTLVIKGTGLYNLYKNGEYKPLDTEEAVELLSEVKKMIPKYLRLMRIQRDIPVSEIEAGVKSSNLRELIHKNMRKKGWVCNCIRCREAGHKKYKEGISVLEPELKILEYEASKGKEYFISFEDENDVLFGYLRLRFPFKPFRQELKGKVAIVRELRVVGGEVEIEDRAKEDIQYQHKGYGRKLLKEAEKIAKKEGYRKIAVISAVGTREYYRKFGYKLEGVYMVKEL